MVVIFMFRKKKLKKSGNLLIAIGLSTNEIDTCFSVTKHTKTFQTNKGHDVDNIMLFIYRRETYKFLMT
jgi:hypothetical protein